MQKFHTQKFAFWNKSYGYGVAPRTLDVDVLRTAITNRILSFLLVHT